jgi:hypothetical protein
MWFSPVVGFLRLRGTVPGSGESRPEKQSIEHSSRTSTRLPTLCIWTGLGTGSGGVGTPKAALLGTWSRPTGTEAHMSLEPGHYSGKVQESLISLHLW